MKILLCAATEMEIAPSMLFFAPHENFDIDILITGIGLVASTYAITKSVSMRRPNIIMQAGLAGTLEPKQKLAEVVVVRNENIGDLGVKEEGFRSLFDMKLAGPDIHPWKNGMLCNEDELLKQIALPIVNGITVNEISTSKERIDYYRQNLDAQIESMEGAALHYVGLMEEIPFLQVRSVSNYIGERNKSNWKMDNAIVNLNKDLQRIIQHLLL